MTANYISLIIAAVSLTVGALSTFIFMRFNQPHRIGYNDRYTSTHFSFDNEEEDSASWRSSNRSRRSRRRRNNAPSSSQSVCSMRTARSMLSSPSGSDDEFFDLDDGDVFFPDEDSEEFREQQTKFLECVDEIMERETCADFREARRLLDERCNEYGETSALLWRLAKCCFLLKTEDKDCSEADKEALTREGLEYAVNALSDNEHDADAHKWFAVLTGDKGKYMGIKDKIRCGYLFKKHLDRAIQLKPDDPSLYHLNGIFQYEICKLSWLEKNIANAVFDTLPQATIKDALEYFHRANSLSKKPWKMNCVYLGKCYHQDGRNSEAKRWLEAASEIEVRTTEDREAEEEITALRRSLKL